MEIARTQQLFPDGGASGYQAVQASLKALGETLDSLTLDLEGLLSATRKNAATAASTADLIAGDGYDPHFVELTAAVATALDGTLADMTHLMETTTTLRDHAFKARTDHRVRYAPLDTVRSGRRERTPKPGVFC